MSIGEDIDQDILMLKVAREYDSTYAEEGKGYIRFHKLVGKKPLIGMYIGKKRMLQPRIELGAERWQRSILPLNHWNLTCIVAEN